MFINMHKCRNDYKALIKLKEFESRNHFTDELGAALQNKIVNDFWKCWKSKFKVSGSTQVVNGTSDSKIIAENFATFFKTIGQTCDLEKHDEFTRKFEADFTSYKGDVFNQVLTVQMGDANIICKLKKGKAAGCDGLAPEHILYSHPMCTISLSILFNACILHGYIPSGFSNGIIIPIPKSNDLDKTSTESYRGVSISCIITKLFEMCLLDLFGVYLQTFDLQFGFKTGIGCSDAILTARLATDFMAERGSTVTLCALDLSKGLDKLDYFCMFLKLMNRRTPRCFISLIAQWCINCTVGVRWGDCLSDPLKLSVGVRQGGVLSPYLFAVYVDHIIEML